jgi:UDP-N-acetylglucosamine 3-dehydrogenase
MQVKIGVIGAGSMGMNHLRVLHEWDREKVELVCFAEPDPIIRQRVIDRFHIPGYADYSTMITSETLDMVSIVTPTQMHYEVASFALQHGLHVLVEKPITSSLDEAEALIDLAHTCAKHLIVGHIERFNPAVIALKQHIASGALGNIFSINARRLGPFPPRIRDVGVILDLATHDIDIMRYLLDAQLESVFAETQRQVHKSCEDLLLGTIRFSNNVLGSLDINWLTPTKVRELGVTGEHGMYLINYLTQDLYFYENDYTNTNWDTIRSISGVSEGTMTRLKVQKAEPLRLEYQNIIDAILEGHAPNATGKDGYEALRIAHLLLESARTRSVISMLAKVEV